MTDCATTLLLAPGVAQIYYGDETGRKLSDARLNVDSNQAFRSDMDWNDIDEDLLSHFRKLGRIRRSNPVIAVGRQKTLDTHTCVRYDEDDKILIRLMPDNDRPLSVEGVFEEGALVEELYTGNTSRVVGGTVTFPEYRNKVALIKEVTR